MQTHSSFVAEAIDFIEDHLRAPLSVSSVCELTPYSSWQFQRVFRAYVGDSIGNYIRGRRFSLAAQQLLQDPSGSRILDLALEYQFGSQEAFSRAFKNHYGLTPGEIKKMPAQRLIYSKPKLNPLKVELIYRGLKKDPEIQTVKKSSYIGLSFVIESPLGVESSLSKSVVHHWEKFDSLRSQIPNPVRGRSYGFAFSQDALYNDESLNYIACIEVEPKDHASAPEGFVGFELPDTQFAAFEVRGFMENCNVITDYIYGIWFPQSRYIRAVGPDYELFIHKVYKRGDPNAISHYFVPIQER
jgi:AraC family transcriptional regulator